MSAPEVSLRPDARIRSADSAVPRYAQRFVLAASLTWAALLLSACTDPPAERSDAPAPYSDTSAASDTSTGVVDWSRRAISLRLDGWSVQFCEGEGPFLCVSRGNKQVGSVELLQSPVEDHAAITEVLSRGGGKREALKAAATELVAVLSADRKVGIGENYHLRAERLRAAPVMGTPGLHVVLEGRLDGQVRERIVQFQAIAQHRYYLLTATGTDGGSLGDFSIGDLKAFEAAFRKVAAASRVEPTAP